MADFMADTGSDRPSLILIAAVAARDRGIGFQGHVPWVIPEDSQRFQRLTLGHTVIMGRRTWDADLLGRPLVDRLNVVVTSRPGESGTGADGSLGVRFVGSLAEAIGWVGSWGSKKGVGFVIGGARLYREALPLVDVLDLTIVEGEHRVDTFFPPYEELLEREFQLDCQSDSPEERLGQRLVSGGIGFRFVRYRRQSRSATPTP
jgi:dihydrofolate reductase